MKFWKERYSRDLVNEMMPLWVAHHAETASKFYGPLDPDLDMYQRCDRMELLKIFTVRQADELRGYQIFVVKENLHSKKQIVATQDILYLSPEARTGLTGYKFIKWCTDQLQADGVHIVHQVIPARGNIRILLERLGYQLEDVNYSKILQGVA